jgi:D-serine deaminase-like pyridoxal phosphate-dependent protein
MSSVDGQGAWGEEFRLPEAIPVPPARVGDPLTAVETPALLLDLEAFEANLAAVHGAAQAMGGRVRAHAKAHRCSEMARRQIDAGAIGVCCQKVSDSGRLSNFGGVAAPVTLWATAMAVGMAVTRMPPVWTVSPFLISPAGIHRPSTSIG